VKDENKQINYLVISNIARNLLDYEIVQEEIIAN
jgi:hypothetical protein